MEIQQFIRETNGFFKAMEVDEVAGNMTYYGVEKEKIIIDHTEVNPNFNSKNVGKQRVMAAVNFARENNIKFIPLCPFAKSVFEKLEEIRDVL